MLTTTILAAAASEPSRGWGGPIALGIVAVVYVAGATLHWTYLQRRGVPSPAEEGDTDTGVKAQVSGVSDTDDTDRDTGWWGRIVEVGGRRVRAAAPVDEEPDEAEDQDEEEEATIQDVIARLEGQGWQYMDIVRHCMEEFEVSESTAKRAIREVRVAQRIA